MKLIDLDSLIAEFNKRCRGECCCCEEDYCGSGNDGCGCKVIDEVPTVDAVEVVRCKNCVCCDRDNGSLWCGLVGLHVDGDHFCAWGEKKDGWLVDRVYKIGEEQERKSVHLTEICADIWGNTK